MLFPLGVLTYSEMKASLDKTKEWLHHKRINVANSRFAEISTNLDLLCLRHEQQQIPELLSTLGSEIVIATLKETMPFIQIYEQFNSLKPHESIPFFKLKKVIGGSFLPKHEDAVTNEARNILFELELAALLKLRGLKIVGFDDIAVELGDATCGIQCKRPMTSKTLPRNIDEALRQLQVGFNASENDEKMGIIALSVDKILDMNTRIVKTKNAKSLEKFIEAELGNFCNRYSRQWASIVDPRVVAVIVMLKYVVEMEGRLSTGIYTIISVPQMHPMVEARNTLRITILRDALNGRLANEIKYTGPP